ncbi:hypothetical protein KVR01_003280 [Diaporthe batatas]|uniref:uncharacterized protein n=1 Tax=Diaporthe batatas TaxID=748121 RepID=UPI001D059B6F|nr:uncharacterized protein KVR01_003280 [Diaporthe batatas]KAG8167591.1 hypothetical protein KVR01_003280 [Diaporthe batatas]
MDTSSPSITKAKRDELSPSELSLLVIMIRNQITPAGVARDWKDMKNFGHVANLWRTKTNSSDTDEQVRELGYGVMRQGINMGLLQKDKDGQESWVDYVRECTNGRDLREAIASGPAKSKSNPSGHGNDGKGKGRAQKRLKSTAQPDSTNTGSKESSKTAHKPGQINQKAQADSNKNAVKKPTAVPKPPALASDKEKATATAPHRPAAAQGVKEWLTIYPAEGDASRSGSGSSTKVSQNLKEQAQLLGLVAMGKLSADGQKRLKKLQDEYQEAMKGGSDGGSKGSL